MVITILFVLIKRWKCPQEWMNEEGTDKLWYIHSMKYCTKVKITTWLYVNTRISQKHSATSNCSNFSMTPFVNTLKTNTRFLGLEIYHFCLLYTYIIYSITYMLYMLCFIYCYISYVINICYIYVMYICYIYNICMLWASL